MVRMKAAMRLLNGRHNEKLEVLTSQAESWWKANEKE